MLASIYVNDAFVSAHRAHASTEGVAHLLPALAGAMADVVPGGKLVVVPEATHWVMAEKPDLVNAEIRKFIS